MTLWDKANEIKNGSNAWLEQATSSSNPRSPDPQSPIPEHRTPIGNAQRGRGVFLSPNAHRREIADNCECISSLFISSDTVNFFGNFGGWGFTHKT